MNLQPVHTDTAPAAIGPYSQAVKAGGFLFCSGQVAFDPATMELVGENVAEQTERVMDNLEAVLEAAGTSFAGVVRTTIFLTTMDDFAAVNEVYGRRLDDHQPAR